MKDLFFYRFGGLSSRATDVKPSLQDEVASVITEVTLLLNTRAPFDTEELDSGLRNCILGYGIQDFIHLSPRSKQDTKVLAQAISASIAAHEPRLYLESVVVESPRACRDSVSAVITGYVHKSGSNKKDLVSFPVLVGAGASLSSRLDSGNRG